jgi:Cytochrome c7 and related cytochrome c
MAKKASSQQAILRALGIIATLFGGLMFVSPQSSSTAAKTNRAAEAQKRSQARPSKVIQAPRKPRIDYAKFSHQTHVVAQKLVCSSCHKVPAKNWKEVRKGDAAFPDVSDFPEHASCLNCHRPQFFARERPAPVICANCHVNNSPRDTSRFVFPSLGDVTDPKLKRRELVSEFTVGFPHDKHIDVVGLNFPDSRRDRGWFVSVSLQEKKKDGPPKSCPVCHETYQPQGNSSEEYVTKPPKNIGDAFWLKKGTFKTAPNSHTVCFTCHSADSGVAPAPTDCNACHKLSLPVQLKVDFDPRLAVTMGITDPTMLGKWSRRISAGAFRHEGGEHPDLNCLGCHNVASPTFSTLDAKTLKVPMRTCGGADGCHVTATTDGGGALNFEIDQRKKDPAFVCTKCHVAFGKEAIPEDHPAAIPTPKPRVKAN